MMKSETVLWIFVEHLGNALWCPDVRSQGSGSRSSVMIRNFKFNLQQPGSDQDWLPLTSNHPSIVISHEIWSAGWLKPWHLGPSMHLWSTPNIPQLCFWTSGDFHAKVRKAKPFCLTAAKTTWSHTVREPLACSRNSLSNCKKHLATQFIRSKGPL